MMEGSDRSDACWSLGVLGPQWTPQGELENKSHGVELGGGLRRLDLHLRHLELGALQPLAQGERQGPRSLALQTLVVDPVLDGLETQLKPRR